MTNSVQKLLLSLAVFLPLLTNLACVAKKTVTTSPVNGEAVQSFGSEAKSDTAKALTESVENVRIGDTELRIVTNKAAKPAPLYFRPHENETTSAEATKRILSEYGGIFVELKSGGERLIRFTLQNKSYTFDPNRIFTAAGIAATLKKYGDSTPEAQQAVAHFANDLLARSLNDKKLLIAVHNNTNEAPLSINDFKDNPEASAVNINPARDADDFFYVTETAHFNFLKQKGFNVALQNSATVTDDGSLSVYCGKRGIGYVNVECEQGHLREQLEMLRAMQEMLRSG